MNNSNQLRAFTDALSLYAWQAQGSEPGTWAIHADVNFTTVRIGAEPDIPIRFRLGIKQARINLILPVSDPDLSLDPYSIDRQEKKVGAINLKRTVGQTEEERNETEASARLGAKAFAYVKAQLGSKLSASQSRGISASTERSEEIFKMVVSGHIVSSLKASWIVKNGEGDRLSGQPWDANQRRAIVVDARHAKRQQGQEVGGIKFEVVCAREDLIIEDLEIKDPSLYARLLSSSHRKAIDQALNQYIRSELQKKGLEARNIEDKFGEMVVLDFLLEGFDVR